MENYFPSKRDFLELAKQGNIVPVYKEILGDLETPVSCFLKLGNRPYSYLLESVEGGERLARFSFIGGAPSLIFKSKGKKISIEYPDGKKKSFETATDPLFELEKILKRFKQAPVKGLPPFSGGAVGYMGYDTVRFFERLPDKNKSAIDIPDLCFIFTDTLFIFDHLHRRIKVVANVSTDSAKDLGRAYDAALKKIDQAAERFQSVVKETKKKKGSFAIQPLHFQSNFKESEFKKAVEKAKTYIRNGDIVQVVLSQAFKAKVRAGSFSIYRALRTINPSPYMFYLNGGGFQLVGSSPEVHVRCENKKAILRPIAGTRPRGIDPAADAKLEKDLLNDPKERAEHVMLVDLGRNDLGRVCDYKSVKVSEFMTIERYSHVMHIVSNVEGQLKKNKTLFDLLRATFPAGTVSGAPKVRAMEIIDELENQKRAFYSGIVGYFSYSGNLDSCITIRTILKKDDTAFLQVGAGIVADSSPQMEYEETLNKGKALFKAIEFAESGILK